MAHEAVHTHDVQAPAPQSGIEITPIAIARLKESIARESLAPGTGVRFAVTGGGCSGLSYAMNFEQEARDDDRVLEVEGVKIFVDAASLPYLEGTVVDYVTGLHKEGFKFVNPKAARTCGCGESFAV